MSNYHEVANISITKALELVQKALDTGTQI